MNKVTVKSDVENPVAIELLEQAIVDISKGMKRISESRINRRGLVALIQDSTKMPKSQIEYVLNSLESLETTYLKKKLK